jgi:hypothetical protein
MPALQRQRRRVHWSAPNTLGHGCSATPTPPPATPTHPPQHIPLLLLPCSFTSFLVNVSKVAITQRDVRFLNDQTALESGICECPRCAPLLALTCRSAARRLGRGASGACSQRLPPGWQVRSECRQAAAWHAASGHGACTAYVTSRTAYVTSRTYMRHPDESPSLRPRSQQCCSDRATAAWLHC